MKLRKNCENELFWKHREIFHLWAMASAPYSFAMSSVYACFHWKGWTLRMRRYVFANSPVLFVCLFVCLFIYLFVFGRREIRGSEDLLRSYREADTNSFQRKHLSDGSNDFEVQSESVWTTVCVLQECIQQVAVGRIDINTVQNLRLLANFAVVR